MCNLILSSDSYKHSMPSQYPPNTSEVFSYIEARGGRYEETVVLGMQPFLKKYLSKPITMEDIDEAEAVINAHMGDGMFNREQWEYILNTHDGYLPLRIKAVPEGTVVKVSNVLANIENTDPKCWWLTTFIETMLLRAIWYPTTVGTKSREIKKLLKEYAEKTGSLDGLDFALHDFGGRGVSSKESAEIGGSAHLVNFKGSDTMEALTHVMKYYGGEMPGFSVPASEHSTITSWGKERETEAYKNMFDQFGGKFPIVSVVSDSYDVFNAVENIWGDELKDMVDASGSMLVIRPDSGEPAEVVGKIAGLLDKQFGSTVNSKGFKVLNGVRILQGDGLNEIDDFWKILQRLSRLGFSTDNIVFGMGGGLLQQVNRDTCKFAMKASAISFGDGVWRGFSKDPITDPGKTSKEGRVTLVEDGEGGHRTVQEHEAGIDTVLKTVYHNGQLYGQTTFDQVRARATL